MATVARLHTEGLLLSGELDERLPPITSGLVVHYPLDGDFNRKLVSIPSTIKVLGYFPAGRATQPWYAWFQANTTFTQTTDLSSISPATALATYDLIIADGYVWSLSGTEINYLKAFVDAGVSVVATANDTRTNVFVSAYTTATGIAHDIVIDSETIIDTPRITYSGVSSTDLLGGIATLQGGAVPYYTRADSGLITGYTYVSPSSGAMMYYDMEGNISVTNQFVVDGIIGALNVSRGGLSYSGITLTPEGLAVEEGTTNLVGAPHNTFSVGNSHGTYHTGTTYNGNVVFSIGTVGSVTGNIVTLSVVDHVIYTYDCIKPQTTGGGLTAGTEYFIKKLSPTTFSVHAYDSSQDGSKGYAVHDSINNDVKIAINATSFPTTWLGGAHRPNQGLVKEVIPNGYIEGDKVYDCMRLHKEHRIETGGSTSYMAYGVLPSVTAGLTYTFSYKARAVNSRSVGATIGLSMYTAGNWPNSTSIVLTKEWQTLRLTSVAPFSGGTNMYFNGTGLTTVDIACLQCEGKTFSTSYVNGSRAAGDFKINTPSLSSECTINFDYKCRERVSNTVISNSNFNFWWGLYLNASGALYTHQANGGSSHTSSYIMPLNQWVNITIKWTATLQSYYADGVLLGSLATVGSTNSANIPVLSLGYGWNVGNATFKNLSIYNRALSDAEVTTLAKNKFKLLPSGNLINEITEQPPIPSDALYVPLGFDASSELGDIVPSENTAVHEENAVFSGQVATNSVVNNGQTTTPWSGDGTPTLSVVDSNTLFRGRKVTRYKPGTSGNCYINGAGDVRTDLLSVNWAVTCYMKRVDGTPITGINSYLYVNGNTNVNIAANIEEVEDGWIKITRERTGLVSGYVTLMGFYGMVNAAEYLIANWSIEPTPFQTPFFETTRPVASLEYNLNDSISMDWSGNWTLAYWKKPVGTYTGLLTGYNLESLGCNSNSVGGGYIWFGKINGANNIAISSANGIVGFATADYFNKWQYVVLRKSGTTVTYNVYLENGNVSTSSVTNAPTANGYVTQYGYDFKMGGWDNSNQGNTYYKDFVIVPSRAISDAEIETLRNTKMRASKDTINISNQVIEGVTL